MEKLNSEFMDHLHKRINKVRKTYILSGKQLAGYRFKNNEIIGKAVVGSVIAASSNVKLKDVPILSIAVGLRYTKADIDDGKYDAVIKNVLQDVSILDYSIENDTTLS